MSTGNFPVNINLNNIYAFCMDTEEQDDFDMEYLDTIDNVLIEFKENKNFLKRLQWDEWRGDDKLIGGFYYYTENGETIEIPLLIRNGYYQGYCFDVNFDDWEEKSEDMEEEEREELQKQIDKDIDHLEKILRDYTMPLKVAARFSNGETIYKKV